MISAYRYPSHIIMSPESKSQGRCLQMSFILTPSLEQQLNLFCRAGSLLLSRSRKIGQMTEVYHNSHERNPFMSFMAAFPEQKFVLMGF